MALGEPQRAILKSLAGMPQEWIPNFESLHAELVEKNDLESACAAVVAGFSSVFETGQDFRKFGFWLSCADELANRNEAISTLGRGALAFHSAIAHMVGTGDLSCAATALGMLESLVEEAQSDALWIVQAAVRAYIEIMSGRFLIADAVISDALHLAPEPGKHLVPKLHLQAALGLLNTVRGRIGDARDCLDAVVQQPEFEFLPTSLWLVCLGHRLLTLAIAHEQSGEFDRTSERLRHRTIPEHKLYFQSYLHYAFGAAALLRGQPETALHHATTARTMGEACHSETAARTAALVEIQALADLGRRDQAFRHLDEMKDRWNDSGAYLLAVSGILERASLQVQIGQESDARKRLEEAKAAWPPGEGLPCNLRSHDWLDTLIQTLDPETTTQSADASSPVFVHITTFGGLRIEIAGKAIYDRDWHGTRSKTLLKALIVLGGQKVSAERLCDLVWPDAEGDIAHQNLKVAIWRLRRLSLDKSAAIPPWVALRQGQVSLVRSHCAVDCHEFSARLSADLEKLPTSALVALLGRYTDDFLPSDDTAPWIATHREALRSLYLRTTCQLAEKLIGHTGQPDVETLLENAIRHAPTHDRCYELLIRHHLACGYPELARDAFRRIDSLVRNEGHDGPSSALKKLAANIG